MPTEPESFARGSGTGTRAGEAGEGVREAVRSAEGQLKEKTHEVKERLQERSKELRSEAEQKAERWTTAMGEQIERVARALRTAGDALEDEGEGRMSGVTMSVAEQVERMGEYLRDENPGAMVRDLEQMARRNPGAFVGTTFVAGLLLGRFLRSSAPDSDGNLEPGREPERRERWPGSLDQSTGSVRAAGTFGSGEGAASQGRRTDIEGGSPGRGGSEGREGDL